MVFPINVPGPMYVEGKDATWTLGSMMLVVIKKLQSYEFDLGVVPRSMIGADQDYSEAHTSRRARNAS